MIQGHVPLKQYLDENPRLRETQMNNLLISWGELELDPGSPYEIFIDPNDVDRDNEDKGAGWCDTVYVRIKLPLEPGKAFLLGCDFQESFAPDEFTVVIQRTEQVYVRVWWT